MNHLKKDSLIIIFCDNKILYDQSENTYTFKAKDLNLKIKQNHFYQ